MASAISIWPEELASLHHQQLNDGQDDHEHEEVVDPDPSPVLGGATKEAAYVPMALLRASGAPTVQSTSPVSPKAAYVSMILILIYSLLCCCFFKFCVKLY